MATSPSAAFLRLRAFIAERMRMSPIDHTLMLKELLGRRSPAPAHNVARWILGSAWWPGFTFNSITAYGDGHDSRIGGDELSDGERDAFQNGKVAATSERRISRVSGSMGEGSKPMWR